MLEMKKTNFGRGGSGGAGARAKRVRRRSGTSVGRGRAGRWKARKDVEKREGSEMNFSKELRVVVESL